MGFSVNGTPSKKNIVKVNTAYTVGAQKNFPFPFRTVPFTSVLTVTHRYLTSRKGIGNGSFRRFVGLSAMLAKFTATIFNEGTVMLLGPYSRKVSCN